MGEDKKRTNDSDLNKGNRGGKPDRDISGGRQKIDEQKDHGIVVSDTFKPPPRRPTKPPEKP